MQISMIDESEEYIPDDEELELKPVIDLTGGIDCNGEKKEISPENI